MHKKARIALFINLSPFPILTLDARDHAMHEF